MRALTLYTSNDTPYVIDFRDIKKVLERNWHTRVNKRGRIYIITNFRKPNNQKTTLSLHHYLFGKPPAGKEFMFRNGSTLDYRRKNLRIVSKNRHRVLTMPTRPAKKKIARGVYLRDGRYRAQISYYGKSITLGSYDTPDEASEAYQKKRKELWNE